MRQLMEAAMDILVKEAALKETPKEAPKKALSGSSVAVLYTGPTENPYVPLGQRPLSRVAASLR
jgi:hypothetical protein